MYLEREKIKRKQRKEAKQDLSRDSSSFFDNSLRSSKNQAIFNDNHDFLQVEQFSFQ
jgi:hypothetical protein